MDEKLCTKCKQTKFISAFGKNKNTKDGLAQYCKLCRNTDMRAKERNRLYSKTYGRAILPILWCIGCKQNKPCEDFALIRTGQEHRQSHCRKCRSEKYPSKNVPRAELSSEELSKRRNRDHSYHIKHLETRMLSSARDRAKEYNVPFNISKQDILDIWPKNNMCPITNLVFAIGRGKSEDNSPSLDRIIPKLGYVKGNIAIISHLANTCKSNVIDHTIFDKLSLYLQGKLL